MTRRSYRRSTVAVRQGVIALALGLPLLGQPLEAQQQFPDTDAVVEEGLIEEEVPVEEVTENVAEPIDVEPVDFEPVDPVLEQPLVEQPEVEQPRVLISEVLIEGIGGHPEEERLQIAAYDAMQVRPGSMVTREELQNDLNAIQATGWFSDVRITPQNSPLGVQVIVQVEPFPTLTEVVLDPPAKELPESVIEETFGSDYGRTLNLNELQVRMKALQTWFAGQGFSLARITGPDRVSPEGVVTLKLTQGSWQRLR